MGLMTAVALSGLALGAYQQKRSKDQAKKAEESFKRTPTIDPEEQRRRIAMRTQRARGRAGGGGVAATNMTGPAGLPGGGSSRGGKTLLGM